VPPTLMKAGSGKLVDMTGPLEKARLVSGDPEQRERTDTRVDNVWRSISTIWWNNVEGL